MEQAIGRVRRQGQKKTVNIYHILAEGTVEMNIMEHRRNQFAVRRSESAMFIPKDDYQSDDELLAHEVQQAELIATDLISDN